MESIYQHTLPNGIRIVHRQVTHTAISHIGIMLDMGSRDEKPHQQGLAHFWEHMAFKGTQKRTSLQIINRLEVVGGELNAYTTKEETAIYASFMCPYFERSLELLSDIVFNSTFPEKELEKEKEVILDEINSYRDNPVEQIYDDFEDLIFPDHPLGHPILGTPESVKSFTKKEILYFMEACYSSDRIVFSSIGNVPFSKIIKLANTYLGHIPKKASPARRAHFRGYVPSFNSFKKETFQSHCVMGNVGYENKNKKKTGLVLLNNLLGGPGMNSRLNLGIREKYGFTYNLESSYSSYEDTGLFTVYLGTDNNYLERTIELVHKELKKLRDTKLGTLQLKNAKQQLIGQIALGQESKVNLMLGFGKSFLTYGKIDTLQKIYKKIEMVKAENLLEIANEVFDQKQMSTMIFESK